jgi:hypothetical protein
LVLLSKWGTDLWSLEARRKLFAQNEGFRGFVQVGLFWGKWKVVDLKGCVGRQGQRSVRVRITWDKWYGCVEH